MSLKKYTKDQSFVDGQVEAIKRLKHSANCVLKISGNIHISMEDLLGVLDHFEVKENKLCNSFYKEYKDI